MNPEQYREMKAGLEGLESVNVLSGKKIYLFGHCNATEELADAVIEMGYAIKAILDNNSTKYGSFYKGIPITAPDAVVGTAAEDTIVLIAVRFYTAMNRQLRKLGYKGDIIKLINYDSFSEYSLSEDSVERRLKRIDRGRGLLDKLLKEENTVLKVFCPFTSFGDVFYAMSYLPAFLCKRGFEGSVVFVRNKGCAQVARLFTGDNVRIIDQTDMDEMIQASVYDEREDVFIAHNDKPYLINISKALNVKKIPFEKLYCCGVYGLPYDTKPSEPIYLKEFSGEATIVNGRTVILSPYANSVVDVGDKTWKQILDKYKDMDYHIYTNVAPGQEPLPGTEPISPPLDELQDLVEKAGHFVGLRSGICDVLKYAKCNKTALYPDYRFGRTKWKSIDVFALSGWKNEVIKG